VRRLHRFAGMEAELHQALAAFNHRRFEPALPDRDPDWRAALSEDQRMLARELELVENERVRWRDRAAAVPREPEPFVRWFEGLAVDGPGQGDPLFPWLAERATLDQLRWFLRQEVAGEAGFEDLVALTQIKMPDRAKLELARNYWDELGRGKAGGMHGPMLGRLSQALRLDDIDVPIVAESLALGNLLVAMAANRRYAYHAIGALGVIELTAPGRATLVNQGLRRLGVRAGTRQYFALHATLDVRHSLAWNEEVVAPLVAERPDVAPAIAEGALMRLEAGRRCFERYRRDLLREPA